MTQDLKILSVCTNLPSAQQPLRGLFVARRLAELSKGASVRALNPEPWFPGIRTGVREQTTAQEGFSVDVRRMFYVPGILKHWDGGWMRRCVSRWLDSLGQEGTEGAVLDAHFGYPEGVGCFLAARERGMPIFITIRGLEVDLFHQPRISRQLISALNEADGVIAVSHSLRQAAVAAGVAGDQITVIPNGVDAQLYCPGSQQEAREALGIPRDQRLIVSVGSLKRVKGHDVLFEALAGMTRHRDARLVCIGSRSDAKWTLGLERTIERLGVRGRIELIGPRAPQEVVIWLRAANLFALASRREGCCNAVLEGLACGVPVVATEVGDNAWFVQPGINGELAPPGNAAALAAALERGLDTAYSGERICLSVKEATWHRAAARAVEYLAGRQQQPIAVPC